MVVRDSRAPASGRSIDGLELLEELGRGPRTVVLRARGDGGDYAVKMLDEASRADAEAATRLRREAGMLARLSHPAIVTVHALVEEQGSPCLVMQYIDGPTLARLVRECALSEPQVRRLGLTLAGALASVHAIGVIHRDIKPDNVLLDATGAPHLIDFDLATQARPQAAQAVAGTLLYAAPEQTGMIKRPVDGRADLYALGALLFECATGRPPFLTTNPSELLRQHAAVAPPSPRQLAPALSAELEQVILRLLAKDPDDRFQSATELAESLQQWHEADATPRPRCRRSRATLALTPIIGRDEELRSIAARLELTRSGAGQLMLLQGDGGVGKSHLLKHAVAAARCSLRPLVLVGACAQASPLPFAPLRDAFETLERELGEIDPLGERHDAHAPHAPHAPRPAAEDDQEVPMRAREALDAAIAADGEVLGRLSPVLATSPRRESAAPHAAQGHAPADHASELPQEQERLYASLIGLLRRLAEAGLSLLAIDALEWADEATAAALAAILRALPSLPIAVILAVRDGATLPRALAHALASASPTRIALAPLQAPAIAALVRSMLGDRPPDELFAKRLALRSQGSPLLIKEYVQALLDSGSLLPRWQRWIATAAGLEQIELHGDVMSLLLGRLQRLPTDARNVLACAAVAGESFPAPLLTRAGLAIDEVNAAIDDSVQSAIIERLAGDRYGFVHPRLRQDILETLTVPERLAWHQRLAEALDTEGATSADDRALYTLAHHYANGDRARRPERVLEVCLAAGLRAHKGYAYEQAYDLLRRANEHASEHGLETGSELASALGRACLKTARLDEAREHLERALAFEADPVRRARIRARLTAAHQIRLDVSRTWEELQRAFAEIGRPYPRTTLGRIARTLASIVAALGVALTPRRRRLPAATAQRLHLTVQLYQAGGVVAYLRGDGGMVLYMGLRQLAPALRLGPRVLAFALAQLGVLLAAFGMKRLSRHVGRRADALAACAGDPLAIANARLYAGFARHITGESREAEARMREALTQHESCFTSGEYLAGCADLITNLMMRGYFREALAWCRISHERAEHTATRSRIDERHPVLTDTAVALAVLGQAATGAEYLERASEIAASSAASSIASVASSYLAADLAGHSVGYHHEAGGSDELLDAAVRQWPRRAVRPVAAPLHLKHFYVHQAYAAVTQAGRADPGARPGRLRELRRAVRELEQAASTPVLAAHAAVARGALLRLCGKPGAALRRLTRAERLAEASDNIWARFEAARQRALLERDRGRPRVAAWLARVAFALAEEQGWLRRARLVQVEHSLAAPRAISDEATSPTVSVESLNLKRHLDALLQVSLASVRVLQPEEQARLALDELIRILGAERAFLFLRDDSTGQLGFVVGRDAARADLAEPRGYSRSVLESVRLSGQPVVVSGTEEGAAPISESAVAHELRSIVAAPLMLQQRLVGLVYLDSRLARGMFTRKDVDFLLAIASHIAIGLEHARAAQFEIRLASEQKRRELAEGLIELNAALIAAPPAATVLSRLCESLQRFVASDAAYGFLIADERLTIATSAGATTAAQEQAWASDERLARCLAERTPLLVSETLGAGGPLHVSDVPRPDGGGVESALVLPLAAQEPFGVVVLVRRSCPFAANETEVASAFAAYAVSALQTARAFAEVQRMAETDELTGLPNRRRFLAVAEQELARARRYGRPLSCMMLDLDHFKEVNDTYGHVVGDEVLRATAGVCRAAVRSIDTLGRYGGEEFVALLPETDSATAAAIVAERLRQSVGAHAIRAQGHTVSVTISIGVATADTGSMQLDELLRSADQALYEAKRSGRNRVVKAGLA